LAWDVFLLAGDPESKDPAKRGTVKGDGFGSPDGLWFDPRVDRDRRLDARAEPRGLRPPGEQPDADGRPVTGEVRRFLTGPSGCEITGVTQTPDGRNMFINIQHPGETASERSDPANPTAVSSWPDGGRPRSATVVIRRRDGGLVGS
jgi:secreted PhoX family phosphatase